MRSLSHTLTYTHASAREHKHTNASLHAPVHFARQKYKYGKFETHPDFSLSSNTSQSESLSLRLRFILHKFRALTANKTLRLSRTDDKPTACGLTAESVHLFLKCLGKFTYRHVFVLFKTNSNT